MPEQITPLWPIIVAMTPCAVLAVLQTALPSIDLTTPNMVYGLFLAVAFIIYSSHWDWCLSVTYFSPGTCPYGYSSPPYCPYG